MQSVARQSVFRPFFCEPINTIAQSLPAVITAVTSVTRCPSNLYCHRFLARFSGGNINDPITVLPRLSLRKDCTAPLYTSGLRRRKARRGRRSHQCSCASAIRPRRKLHTSSPQPAKKSISKHDRKRPRTNQFGGVCHTAIFNIIALWP